jgi:hypothetical protein
MWFRGLLLACVLLVPTSALTDAERQNAFIGYTEGYTPRASESKQKMRGATQARSRSSLSAAHSRRSVHRSALHVGSSASLVGLSAALSAQTLPPPWVVPGSTVRGSPLAVVHWDLNCGLAARKPDRVADSLMACSATAHRRLGVRVT